MDSNRLVRIPIALLIVVLMMLILSTSSVFASSGTELNLYKNQKYNFEMQYPGTWKVIEGKNTVPVVLMISDKSQNEFHNNVNVIIQDLSAFPHATIEEYTADVINQLKKSVITDFELIDNLTYTTADSPARKFVYRGRQGVYSLVWTQVYVIVNEKGYIITITCDNTQYKNLKDVINEITNSFAVTKDN